MGHPPSCEMRKDAAPCLVVLRIKFPKCGPAATRLWRL